MQPTSASPESLRFSTLQEFKAGKGSKPAQYKYIVTTHDGHNYTVLTSSAKDPSSDLTLQNQVRAMIGILCNSNDEVKALRLTGRTLEAKLGKHIWNSFQSIDTLETHTQEKFKKIGGAMRTALDRLYPPPPAIPTPPAESERTSEHVSAKAKEHLAAIKQWYTAQEPRDDAQISSLMDKLHKELTHKNISEPHMRELVQDMITIDNKKFMEVFLKKQLQKIEASSLAKEQLIVKIISEEERTHSIQFEGFGYYKQKVDRLTGEAATQETGV